MDTVLLRNIMVGGSLSDILIEGPVIAEIVPAGKPYTPHGTGSGSFEEMDCAGMTAVPGFVNMHTHAAMSLMRGLGEDIRFHEWINRIWNVESKINEEYVYWGTKVACIEMIRTGTTMFNDHYWHIPAAVKAASETGIRAIHSYVLLDRHDPAEAERQKAECIRLYEASRDWPATSGFAMAFHAIYSVSEDLMVWAAEFASEHGLNLHIHLCETEREVEDCKAAHGVTPVRYLDSLGILGKNVIAAHTLWVSDEDVEILGKRGVTCVHNINSNLKLSSGYMFRYNELRDAGANICIGTDGCASSNNLDMLEAMKTSAIMQKAWRKDPSAMPLDELMDVATINGAKAFGLDAGEIREGALADLMLVDTGSSFFMSPGSFLANFVYSAHSDCIDSLICNGRFVMRHRQVKDEKDILAHAREIVEKTETEL